MSDQAATAIPPEQAIIQMRQRVLSGGPKLSREEVRDVLVALRANRRAAAGASGKKTASAKTPARSPSELLAALKSKQVESGS